MPGREWVLLSEGEYDYKQFSSINLLHVLCIIFTNADLEILLMNLYCIVQRYPDALYILIQIFFN